MVWGIYIVPTLEQFPLYRFDIVLSPYKKKGIFVSTPSIQKAAQTLMTFPALHESFHSNRHIVAGNITALYEKDIFQGNHITLSVFHPFNRLQLFRAGQVSANTLLEKTGAAHLIERVIAKKMDTLFPEIQFRINEDASKSRKMMWRKRFLDPKKAYAAKEISKSARNYVVEKNRKFLERNPKWLTARSRHVRKKFGKYWNTSRRA